MLCLQYLSVISLTLEYDNAETKTFGNLFFSYFKSLGAELMWTIVNAWAHTHTHKMPTKISEIKEVRLFSESKSHELFTNN